MLCCTLSSRDLLWLITRLWLHIRVNPSGTSIIKIYHGLYGWYVSTVFNSTSDNEIRLKPQADDVLSQKSKDFLYVININNNYILDYHPIGWGEGSHMSKDLIRNTM